VFRLYPEVVAVAGIKDLEAIVAQLTSKPSRGDDGFRTVKQLRQESGVTEEKILVMLRLLKERGLLETKKVEAETIQGHKYWLTAYRVKSRNGSRKPKNGK
jgi:hypothetical protein